MNFDRKQQCKAIIIKKQRRCLKYEICKSEYCEWHGPLCQALTNSGSPCNSMVFNFRDGSRYCENHANVGTERHIGVHEPSYSKVSLNKVGTNNKQRKDLHLDVSSPHHHRTTITITRKETTTTIITSNEDHLCKIFDLLELSTNNKKY